VLKNKELKTTKKVRGAWRLHNRTFKIYTIIVIIRNNQNDKKGRMRWEGYMKYD
jgi:hypothetical protein